MKTKQRAEELLSQNRPLAARRLLLDSLETTELGEFYTLMAKAEFAIGDTGRARALAVKATRISPSVPEAWRVRALPEITSRNVSLASENLRRASLLAPHESRSYATATTFHRSTNALSKAKRSARQALIVDPISAEAMRANAALCYAQSDLGKAYAENKKALILDPRDGRAYFLLAILPNSDLKLVNQFLRRSLTITPIDEGPRTYLTRVYGLQRQVDKFVNEIRRLMLVSPHDTSPYRTLVNSMAWQNKQISPLNIARRARPLGLDTANVTKNLAMRLRAAGRDADALSVARLGLQRNPEAFEPAYILGILLVRGGDAKQAEMIGKRLINKAKEDHRGWVLMVEALKAQDFQDAVERVLKGGLRYVTEKFPLWSLYGQYLESQERYAHSLKIFKRALCAAPRLPQAYEHLSRAYDAVGNEERAAAMLARGQRFKGKSATAIAALANMTLSSGDTKKALEQAQDAQELDPTHPAVVDVTVNALIANGEIEKALEVARVYNRHSPDRSHAVSLYAKTLALSGDAAEAAHLVEEKMAESPQVLEYMSVYLQILKWLGTQEKATPYYQRHSRLQSPKIKTRSPLAMHLLWTSRWGRGFDEYETGFEQVKRGRGRKRKFIQTRWDGQDLTGKSIVIHTEQGVGDEIMFTTLVNEITSWASKVYVECTKRLVPLYRAAFPNATVFQLEKNCPYEKDETIDYYVPVGSLGKVLRRRTGLFGRNRPYIIPKPDLAQRLREKYKAKHNDSLIVGVGWRGGSMPLRRIKRSFELIDYAPILKAPGVTFVCVQYGDVEEEVRAASRAIGKEVIFDPEVDPLKDMAASAAQIAACDLIISATNAGVHTAGALGVPCWTLVPYESDWRWTWKRDDVVWYPGMRLFKQQTIYESWEAVIERVGREFEALLSGDRDKLRARPADDLNW